MTGIGGGLKKGKSEQSQTQSQNEFVKKMFHLKKNVPHQARFRHFVCLSMALLWGAICSTPTYASQGPHLRNPQGSQSLGLGLGGGGGGNTPLTIAVGGHFGYAVLTGVVPGVRGLVIWSEAVATELAATLTLTPPFESYVVPFAALELGGRFDPIGTGLMYGAGAGVYLGRPRAAFALQLGYMYRMISYGENQVFDASRPTISVSLQF